MGGKNHQPCGRYLKNSTRLSRCLSVAYAELEHGNVALEDLLLEELDGRFGTVAAILLHLRASQEALKEARSVSTDLRQQMDENNFADLPTLRRLNLEAIGVNLAAKNRVSMDAWNRVAQKTHTRGFSAVLAYFDDQIDALAQKTETLVCQIAELSGAAEKAEVNCVLEENRPGNIKSAFAEVYSCWAVFSQEFLASSLLSTELWYAWTGHGSLCDREARTKAA